MTRPDFRRFARVLVMSVAAWPFLQFALVHWSGGTPWKLFGLAMYTTVHETELEVFDTTAGKETPLAQEQLSPGTVDELKSLRRRRRVFGRWVEPAAEAARILKEKKDVRSLAIAFRVKRLDATTGRLQHERAAYHYDRASSAR